METVTGRVSRRQSVQLLNDGLVPRQSVTSRLSRVSVSKRQSTTDNTLIKSRRTSTVDKLTKDLNIMNLASTHNKMSAHETAELNHAIRDLAEQSRNQMRGARSDKSKRRSSRMSIDLGGFIEGRSKLLSQRDVGKRPDIEDPCFITNNMALPPQVTNAASNMEIHHEDSKESLHHETVIQGNINETEGLERKTSRMSLLDMAPTRAFGGSRMEIHREDSHESLHENENFEVQPRSSLMDPQEEFRRGSKLGKRTSRISVFQTIPMAGSTLDVHQEDSQENLEADQNDPE